MKHEYRTMTEEEKAEERRKLEERDEYYARWHPVRAPQCGGPRGQENDAFRV